MTTPDEIVQRQLAEGFNVTGEVAAPIYGDQARADHPPAEIDLSKATPANPDIEALKQRLAAMEAAQAAAAQPAPAEPADNTPVLSANVPADLREAIQAIHERLAAVEHHLGL
jgi:hypothetical protein